MSAGLPRCFHCGAEIPPGMAVEEAGAEAALCFCCHGCHGAFLLITGAGLDDFYRRRDWKEEGLPSRAFQDSYRDSLLSRFVYQARDGSAIDIIIDGIRCASCVWLNERMIGRLEGVRVVRVNYATGRARVVFDPAVVSPAVIFSRIAGLGYAPRPYSRSAADESARREQKDLLFRFGTAVFLSMQLMAYSFALYAGYLQGIEPDIRNYLQLFSLLVTTPIVFYCGRPFLAGALRSLRNLTPNMELLIATGTISSFGYSVYATFSGREVYYETPAMIVTLILAGRLLENSAKRRASAGIEHLSRLCAGDAQRFAGHTLESVDTSELKAGDVVLVSPGDRFPADGTIMEGATDIDESAATGEALPVVKRAGEPVLAGTANLTGAVRVRCDRESADSFLARVARLVEEAQTRRAPIQGIADRVSASFVPAVAMISIVTFAFRFTAGEAIGDAVMNALAVLVVACPCALGLATPTAIAAGTGTAAKRGIIFRGGDVLERLAQVKVAVFDKTGTITCGRPAVIEVRAAEGTEVREMLSLAASVEMGSLHPVATAIREEAASAGVIASVGTDMRTVAGGGVTGRVDGEEVAVGSANFLSGLGVAGLPEEWAAPPGCGVICVARSGRYCGSILVKDRVRDDAAALVSYFHRAGTRTMLLSGDRQECAAEAAAAVGIGACFGELAPADKAARIEELRIEGVAVVMVGDGINDAPALSTADVGCAVAGGTDIAIETSDLVLMKPDLERLSCAHRIACRTMSVVRQNLAWAFLYNAVGIPLAVTGRLTPIVAAAAMAVSSLCVVANSLRLTEGSRG